ncbi:MAG: DsbA family protein [Gemmatimonadetes bacterium]|nr:DsbA family protein [Gemmatimonadota bacterium]
MAQGQKPFYLALGAIAIAGVGFLAYRMMGGGAVSIPANVTVSAADTSGFNGYLLGSPTAPIEISEYADFTCPACAAFSTVQFPDVRARLIETGKARFRYRDFPLEGGIHTHSRVAAHSVACANDQGKFWELAERQFLHQNDWALAGNGVSALKDVAKAAGLDTGAWQSCMESAKYAGRIQASLDEGARLGVGSTPSFLIGGRIYTGLNSDGMVQLVDSLIAAQAGTKAP